MIMAVIVVMIMTMIVPMMFVIVIVVMPMIMAAVLIVVMIVATVGAMDMAFRGLFFCQQGGAAITDIGIGIGCKLVHAGQDAKAQCF
jgi:hypothetical protein